MKPIRPYRLRYHARLGLCATLMMFGFLAIAGETEDNTHWLLCLLLQFSLFVSSWTLAFWLYAKWGLDKTEKRIDNIQKMKILRQKQQALKQQEQ